MQENTFTYKGVKVAFGGFYQNQFMFFLNNKVVAVSSVQELDKHLDSLTIN